MAEHEPPGVSPISRPQITLREALVRVKAQMKADHDAVLVHLPEFAGKTPWFVQAKRSLRSAYLRGLALHYEIVPDPFNTSKNIVL